ncbi:MAG: hypothetical protein ACRDKS_08085 [Actinomycetota bacterium]
MARRAWVIVAASLLLSVMAGTAPAVADSGHAEFEWVLLGHEGEPNKAMASNGDVIEMTSDEGSTFSIHPKTVTGGGRFTHIAADGNVVGEGDYEAVKLLSFHSYGNGTPQGLPENFFGGLAIIRVALHPDGTDLTIWGNLQIDCLLGKPPAGAEEGIRLSVPGINFNREAGGDTLFLAVED